MNTTHFMKVQDLVEASTTRHFRNIRNRLKSEGCESGAAQLSGLAAALTLQIALLHTRLDELAARDSGDSVSLLQELLKQLDNAVQ